MVGSNTEHGVGMVGSIVTFDTSQLISVVDFTRSKSDRYCVKCNV